jgi:hypothetical protein
VKADNEGMNQVMTGMENQLKAYAAKEEATNQLVKESILKVLTVLMSYTCKAVLSISGSAGDSWSSFMLRMHSSVKSGNTRTLVIALVYSTSPS